MSTDLVLAASALLMGLAATPHCAAMCGALQAGIIQRHGTARALPRMLALHAGRLVGYALAGAALAASFGALRELTALAPVLRPLWAMLHVALALLGLSLLWTGRLPAWAPAWVPAWAPGARRRRLVPGGGAALAQSPGSDTRPLTWMRRATAPAGPAAVGACWALMPCGLLQSALLLAALASDPLAGAAVMAAFAVGTSTGLVLVCGIWWKLGAAGRPRDARPSLRLAGLLLATTSALAVGQALAGHIAQLLCLR